MSETKYCEDCGDECETRRTRCPNCGKLVCSWCYYHVHGVYSFVASEHVGLVACQQSVEPTVIHGGENAEVVNQSSGEKPA